MRRESKRYCVSQKTCLLLLHFLHDIEKGELLHMTIHVVTSPGVISRKNAKRYLSEHLIFPENVTSIEEEAFMRQPCIKKITFPEGLEHIGARTFQDCIHLEELNLPDSLTAFDKEAFSGCKGLTTVNLPSSLKNIPDKAFYKCRKLENILLPEGIQKIGEGAFYFANIAELHLPSTITAIKDKAFFRCNRLTSVTIPPSVERIGEEAFHGCNHLKVLEIAHEPRYIGERVVNRSTKIRCYKNSKVDVYCQKNQILAEYIEK